ncbi:MAG: tetratricopeptide repeat protein [Gammaproteobacteria bacterium]|nr:tetratricopeptide repeat protein [Gammaproteobacteria bacterium]
MRLIVMVILASIIGYGVLQIDKIDPDNYVKLYLGNYVIEIKVLGFLVLLLGAVLLMYFLIWLVKAIWRSPKTLSSWQHRRNRNKAEEKFGAGYLSLIKGDWSRAETQLTTKSDHSRIPYVNYLAAARAAQEQGRFQQRDDYLRQAYEAAPGERLAIGLTKARLHEKAGQVEEALATLEDIRNLGKKNPQYTAMLIQIRQQAENWQGIQELLPIAKKQKALPESLLSELQDDIHRNALLAASDKAAAWKALPRDQRKRTDLRAIYVQDLVEKGETVEAEKLIRSTLKRDWSDELVDIYGQLTVDKPHKLLRRVEGWLLARPENPHLHLAAGRLAKAAKSFEAAKEFLQAAISTGPLPAAYSVLGEVYEANNESGKALQMYRVGMQVAVQDSNLDRSSAVSQLEDSTTTTKLKQEVPADNQAGV